MKYIKHIIPLLCVAFVTIIILQLFYLNIVEHEENRCWDELSTTVQDLNKEISIKFNDEISKLHLLETIMVNGNMSSTENLSDLYLDKVQPKTMFTRIDVLYPDNTLVSNGQLIEISKDIQFDRIKSKGEYLTSRKTDFLSGKPCVYYVLPIINENEISAVLIGVIDLDTLYGLFEPIIYNGKANICIIDSSDGNYIMDSWHAELWNVYEMGDRQKLKDYEDVDFKEDIKNLKTGAIAFVSKTTGKNLYMYYAPLNIFEWETAVFAQEDVLFSKLILLRKRFFITGMFEILLLILYFLWNTYLIKQLQKINKESEKKNEQLEFLSYRDMLTTLYNRHKFMEMLNFYSKNELSEMGVAYIDLNGLKHMNDSISHEAGDEYICNTARLLTDAFGECCYRIGGDEFVVLIPDTSESEFANNIETFKNNMANENISTSVGFLWKEKCEDLNAMLREAERQMYIEKQKYYKTQETSALTHYHV